MVKNGFDLKGYNDRIKDYIGATVWWQIHKTHIPTDIVQSTLQEVGLSSGLMSEDVSEKVAFKRAGKAISKVGRNCFSRSIVDDGDKCVLGIVHERKDVENEELNYLQQITARLDKTTHELNISGDGQEMFISQYEHFKKNITDEDIRAMVRRVVERLGGVPLRPTGGIYFIPKNKVSTIVKLEAFVSKLNCGKVSLLRVPDGVAEREVAWESAKGELERKIENITDAVEAIGRRMPFVTRQEEKLENVRRMMDYYIELTDSEGVAEEIKDKLQDAQRMIGEKMREIEAMG